MAKLKVKLSRNLRRSVMRGHPWIYKENIVSPGPVDKAQLCQVVDTKGELAWAIYDPHSPLSLRILSTDKAPPNQVFFEKRFTRAHTLRSHVRSDLTTAYRLFNGEGDLLPGIVCDVYNDIAVLQFDGQGPSEYWDKSFVAQWLIKNTHCKSVIEKTRRNTDRTTELLAGEDRDPEVVIKENGVLFKVNLEKGQKTGFFLDQRDNRDYIRRTSEGKSVLNLFSYSGGFSIYAGLGRARKVASLDVSKGAIALAEENWAMNGLEPAQHTGLCVDVFEYLEGDVEMWDHIIVDPPSMSHSESQKQLAKSKYIEVFTAAAKRVRPQGELSLSSCSSHVSFNDFFEIIDETLSNARRRGQILRVSGQGPDHPFPHASHEQRYLKFVHLALD
ncbi:MAG: class I SAM-dependent rRNA methyltransferase [Bdellovibrionaceae bacterium]|nr:class I SAM-dependent rRNA methyltransferase [Pseudobdellovibrionaceae bacterium]